LTGEFHGIRSDTDVSDLARAVLEGAAYGLGHISKMLGDAGIETRVVTCAGSPSQSRLWCEIKASVLRVPFDVSGFSELSAYGAALAAGAGAGWWPLPSKAPAGSWPRPPMSRVEPDPDPSYDEGLDRFIQLGDIAEERTKRA
jgi:xylulokinase